MDCDAEMLLAFALAALSRAPVDVAAPAVIEIGGSALRVRDVMPELRGRSGDLAIAHLPDGRSSMTLSGAAVASLVRRALPGAAVGPLAEAIMIRRKVRATAEERTPCSQAAICTTSLRESVAVSHGDALTLVSRAGPVTVERAVTALQPGQRGGRVFVRAGDGLVFAVPVAGDDIYLPSNWSAMSSDRKASGVGDLLSVVIFENSESANSTKSESKRSTQLGGSISAGSLDERGALQVGGGYTGGGAVTRQDRLVAQITVTVRQVLPGGDLIVAGEQAMKINGEATQIGIEGRLRREDITGDNRVLSSRIADARIIYDGKGFAARSAKPGLVARLFRFLGLG